MKRLWNFRLYLEGIKKIRLLGIAFSIVIVVLNALVPVTHMLVHLAEQVRMASDGVSGLGKIVPDTIPNSVFAIPMALLMVFTPFFFYTMFAYLNSRSESDFYHAIPYTRSCVYVTFTAAVYTWIFGILITSSLLTGLLWAINPFASVSITAPLLTIAEYAVATLLIGAYAAIAVGLTGTKVSQFFVTLILLFFIRIAISLFVLSVSNEVPILVIERSLLMLLSPRYYFPIAIFWNMVQPGVLSNAVIWIYTLAVAIGGLVLGCVIYVKRKSETATKSAPNRAFQHVFRCLFTLPWVASIATLIICEPELSFIFVMATITLVVYFLYELITTKSGKSMLKSAPFLAVLVAFLLLFIGGVYGVRAIVLSQDYTADEIVAVGVADKSTVFDSLFGGYTGGTTYESLSTTELLSSSPEARKLAADALHETIEVASSKSHSSSYYWDNHTQKTVLMKLSSGRVVGKTIRFTDENYDAFMLALGLSDEYGNALIRLPKDSEIVNIYETNGNVTFSDDREARQAFSLFRSEFDKLSREEQIRYKQELLNSSHRYAGYAEPATYNLSVSGESSNGTFSSYYPVPETFTETIAFLDGIYAKNVQKNIQVVEDFLNGKYDSGKQSIDLEIRFSYPDDVKAYTCSISLDPYVFSERYLASVKELVGFYLHNTEWNTSLKAEDVYTDWYDLEKDQVYISYYDYSNNLYNWNSLRGRLKHPLTEAEAQRVRELYDAILSEQNGIPVEYVEPVEAM